MSVALCSDWLPERPRWAHLARSGFPALARMHLVRYMKRLASESKPLQSRAGRFGVRIRP